MNCQKLNVKYIFHLFQKILKYRPKAEIKSFEIPERTTYERYNGRLKAK